MALPVRHKSAVPGYRSSQRLGYTYVGADDFSDAPTVEDVYNLFADALFVGPTGILLKSDIALIISGEFFQPYPDHDPNEEVTTLSYGVNAQTAYQSIKAWYEENPNAAAVAWLNDFVQNFTLQGRTHYWFAVYRVSIVD